MGGVSKEAAGDDVLGSELLTACRGASAGRTTGIVDAFEDADPIVAAFARSALICIIFIIAEIPSCCVLTAIAG